MPDKEHEADAAYMAMVRIWHRNPGGWGDKKWREEYEERHRRWREARDHDGRRNVEGS